MRQFEEIIDVKKYGVLEENFDLLCRPHRRWRLLRRRNRTKGGPQPCLAETIAPLPSSGDTWNELSSTSASIWGRRVALDAASFYVINKRVSFTIYTLALLTWLGVFAFSFGLWMRIKWKEELAGKSLNVPRTSFLTLRITLCDVLTSYPYCY